MPELDVWNSEQLATYCNYTSTMPPFEVPKKLSPKQKRIAELEQQLAEKNETIGVLLFLHR